MSKDNNSSVNITCNERPNRACAFGKFGHLGLSSEDVARFWSKVRKDAHGCWEWTASRLNGRYGQFTYTLRSGQVHAYAHRVSWELVNGAVPAKHYICHTCDNTICVNPEHLFLGTQFQNMRDASRKGRLSVPRARNRETVAEVRRLWLAGGVLQCDLAAQFGVHPVQIGRWLKAVKDKPYQRRKAA